MKMSEPLACLKLDLLQTVPEKLVLSVDGEPSIQVMKYMQRVAYETLKRIAG